jgi:hypothetical protein
MNDDWVVDLHDAVAVYRDYNGKLRVDQSYQMTTGEGAAWGGFMGSLIGLTLAPPYLSQAELAQWLPGLLRRALPRELSTLPGGKMSLASPTTL